MQAFYNLQHICFILESQQKEIAMLKDSIGRLSKELQQLKERPAMNVERLEYKFDQLKVETLEGTLNIGISPSDLDSIDDLSVPSSGPEPYSSFARHPDLYRETLENINTYIQEELDSVIKNSESHTGQRLDEHLIALIKEDIRKQITNRTDHYLQFFSNQPDTNVSDEELYHKVYQTVVADINKAVHGFIVQMPNKGGSPPYES